MSEDLKDIVLEKDAFEPEPSVTEPSAPDKPDRPDLVEIGDAFDTIAIHDSLAQIAKTNQLDLTWEELARLLETLLDEVTTMCWHRNN